MEIYYIILLLYLVTLDIIMCCDSRDDNLFMCCDSRDDNLSCRAVSADSPEFVEEDIDGILLRKIKFR